MNVVDRLKRLTNSVDELSAMVAVLHIAVTELYVAECQRQPDPIAAAKALSEKADKDFVSDGSPSADPEWEEKIHTTAREFFAQIVSSRALLLRFAMAQSL